MSSPAGSTVERTPFGATPAGDSVGLFTLRTGGGCSVQISEYGATVVSLQVPDRRGRPGGVVLGFSSLSGYLAEHPFIGCTVGRYANRIAGARFDLDRQRFELPANDGPNHLHGGPGGFGRRVFAAEAGLERGCPAVELALTSPAGDQGYPGRLDTRVRFVLAGDGDSTTLEIEYEATTDAATVVSLTHHGYFNLRDGGRSSVLDHELTVFADHALPLDDAGIPSDGPAAVAGTRLDFRSARRVGAWIEGCTADRGYDDCFMLERPPEPAGLRLAATVRETHSGRSLDVLTDRPALQLYTANSLDGSLVGHDQIRYGRHAALCLETQHPPDAPNQPGLPSARLEPGQRYQAHTHYRFGIDG